MQLRYILIIIIIISALAYIVSQSQEELSLEKKGKSAEVGKQVGETKSESAQEKQEIKEYCKGMDENLAACNMFKCVMPHPRVGDFMVKHQIMGFMRNGLCVHIQSIPGGGKIVCNYSEPLRLLVAKTARRVEPVTEEEQNMLAMGFEAECKVFPQEPAAQEGTTEQQE